MDEAVPPAPRTKRIRIELPEGVLEREIPLPEGRMRLAELAVTVLGMASGAAMLAVRESEKIGRPVSCSPGCAACCRQLIPLSVPEACMIAELVDGFPEARREEVIERFAAIETRLQAEGFFEKFNALDSASPDAAAEKNELAAAYWAMQIACPFLEDERCGIYPHRPAVCREYLVTSPAEHCSAPFEKTVEKLDVPARLTEALAAAAAKHSENEAGAIPLTFALVWSRANPEQHFISADPAELLEAVTEAVAAGLPKSRVEKP